MNQRGCKISTHLKKEDHSKHLFLNILIIILTLIIISLGYITFGKVSTLFEDSNEELLNDIAKSKMQVEVLNGCGASGVADKLTEFLRSNKIDVVNLGNYRSFEIENSIIISRNDNIKNAERLAELVGLGESSIIKQTNPDYLLDVTFILGKDYRKLVPLNKRLN